MSTQVIWRDWRWPVAVLLAVVFFIPMRRYTIPLNLPFQLEPYRPLIALLVGAWFLSLLAMRTSFRKTSLDKPLFLMVIAVVGSLLVNPTRFNENQAEALKVTTIFLSFVVVYYLTVSVVRRVRDLDTVVKLLVVFGSIVAVLAVIESRTGYSPFIGLDRVIPLLNPLPAELTLGRGARLRAFGSAEHPIALGAMLILLAPFAVYLALVTRRAIWWVPAAILAMGAVSTVSRTAILMLVVILLFFAFTRWTDVRRQWFLIFPLVAVIHFALPGTLGTLKGAFLPSGGLIAEQETFADSASTGGRVSDIAPSLEEFRQKPLLGDGFGTRISVGDDANGRLLDNQWLGLLIDVGLIGALAFAWMILRFVRRQLRLARSLDRRAAYLPLACGGSALAYAIGMATYDAFSFTQTTFVLFLILGIGSSCELARFVDPSSERDRARLGSEAHAGV